MFRAELGGSDSKVSVRPHVGGKSGRKTIMSPMRPTVVAGKVIAFCSVAI